MYYKVREKLMPGVLKQIYFDFLYPRVPIHRSQWSSPKSPTVGNYGNGSFAFSCSNYSGKYGQQRQVIITVMHERRLTTMAVSTRHLLESLYLFCKL